MLFAHQREFIRYRFIPLKLRMRLDIIPIQIAHSYPVFPATHVRLVTQLILFNAELGIRVIGNAMIDFRCGLCADNFYKYGLVCHICPAQTLGVGWLAVIGVVVLGFILLVANQMRKMDVAFISIVT